MEATAPHGRRSRWVAARRTPANPEVITQPSPYLLGIAIGELYFGDGRGMSRAVACIASVDSITSETCLSCERRARQFAA